MAQFDEPPAEGGFIQEFLKQQVEQRLAPQLFPAPDQFQPESESKSESRSEPGPIPEVEFNDDGTVRLPFNETPVDIEDRVSITIKDGRIDTLTAHDVEVAALLELIARHHRLNVVTKDELATRITVTLSDVGLEDALNSILSVSGYAWSRQNDILIVSQMSPDAPVSPALQGRQLRVFPLNFIAATDVEPVVTGLLSPIGSAYSSTASSTDNRRTRDMIVVEDLPEYISRVAEYICQVDRPPRQVLIEAHVLQVDLDEDTQHGINLSEITQISGTKLDITSRGFADASASPSLLVGIDGSEFDGLLQAIKTTNDAKTLASPKVLVLNGQEAKIQIGGQLGFLTTTTTETSTLQNVQFLDVGIVLTVTPIISDDNQVVMQVKPEVSNGRVNANGLPEEQTTEVETAVILQDGHGMVIGGLIEEEDNDSREKVPILGEMWLVGGLFQRQEEFTRRREVIIALIPRIVPYWGDYQHREQVEYDRASTPLTYGPLCEYPRPWEPKIPDVKYHPNDCHLNYRYWHYPDGSVRCPTPEVDHSLWQMSAPVRCRHGFAGGCRTCGPTAQSSAPINRQLPPQVPPAPPQVPPAPPQVPTFEPPVGQQHGSPVPPTSASRPDGQSAVRRTAHSRPAKQKSGESRNPFKRLVPGFLKRSGSKSTR